MRIGSAVKGVVLVLVWPVTGLAGGRSAFKGTRQVFVWIESSLWSCSAYLHLVRASTSRGLTAGIEQRLNDICYVFSMHSIFSVGSVSGLMSTTDASCR